MSYSLSEALGASLGLEEFDVDINIGNDVESVASEVEGTESIIESAAELEDVTDKVETAIDDVESLENIHLVLKASAMNGGMNNIAYAMTNVALESISKKYGSTANDTLPSMESFNSSPNQVVRISMEETEGTVRKFYETIKALLAKAWATIKNFFGKTMDYAKNCLSRLGGLFTKVDMIEINKKVDLKVDENDYSVLGTTAGNSTKEIINNYSKDASMSIDFLKLIFKEANKIIQSADFNSGFNEQGILDKTYELAEKNEKRRNSFLHKLLSKIKKPHSPGPLTDRIGVTFFSKLGLSESEKAQFDLNYSKTVSKFAGREIKTTKDELRADMRLMESSIKRIEKTARSVSNDFELLKKNMERAVKNMENVSGKSELQTLLTRLVNACTAAYVTLLTDINKAHSQMTKLSANIVKEFENFGKEKKEDNASTESYGYNPFFA